MIHVQPFSATLPPSGFSGSCRPVSSGRTPNQNFGHLKGRKSAPRSYRRLDKTCQYKFSFLYNFVFVSSSYISANILVQKQINKNLVDKKVLVLNSCSSSFSLPSQLIEKLFRFQNVSKKCIKTV